MTLSMWPPGLLQPQSTDVGATSVAQPHGLPCHYINLGLERKGSIHCSRGDYGTIWNITPETSSNSLIIYSLDFAVTCENKEETCSENIYIRVVVAYHATRTFPFPRSRVQNRFVHVGIQYCAVYIRVSIRRGSVSALSLSRTNGERCLRTQCQRDGHTACARRRNGRKGVV